MKEDKVKQASKQEMFVLESWCWKFALHCAALFEMKLNVGEGPIPIPSRLPREAAWDRERERGSSCFNKQRKKRLWNDVWKRFPLQL